jgi:putative transcriptional regulator
MKVNVHDLLPEYVLGTLPPQEMASLRAEIDESPALQSTVAEISEALSALPAALPAEKPPARVRARLLASLDTVDRFAPFLDVLSRALDMTVAAVQALCARIDRRGDWEAGPAAGIALIHFRPGPRHAAAVDAGLVRMTPGTSFPHHRHLGPEWNMVLEGTLLDGARVYLPGDVFLYDRQSDHLYSAGPGRDLVMVAMHHGIEDLASPP